jgi:hypothetical protein
MNRHEALIGQLEAASERLTERVLEEMYADPFWRERFGERADKHGRQDGRFHVQYLQQALAEGDPAVLQNYARWLQQVLTARGMCTLHLAENFERLALAISHEPWADRQAAVDLLRAAKAALEYRDGLAGEVQRRCDTIVLGAAVALAEAGDDEPLQVAELANLVSYCADALALASPQVLANHVAWLAGYFDRHGLPRARLVRRQRWPRRRCWRTTWPGSRATSTATASRARGWSAASRRSAPPSSSSSPVGRRSSSCSRPRWRPRPAAIDVDDRTCSSGHVRSHMRSRTCSGDAWSHHVLQRTCPGARHLGPGSAEEGPELPGRRDLVAMGSTARLRETSVAW